MNGILRRRWQAKLELLTNEAIKFLYLAVFNSFLLAIFSIDQYKQIQIVFNVFMTDIMCRIVKGIFLYAFANYENKSTYLKYTALMTVFLSLLSCCFLLLVASLFTTDKSSEFGILQVYTLQVQIPSYCFQIGFLMLHMSTKMYFTIGFDKTVFFSVGGYCLRYAEYHNTLTEYHNFNTVFLVYFRSQLMIPKSFAARNPCILKVIVLLYEGESTKQDTNKDSLAIDNSMDIKTACFEMTSLTPIHKDTSIAVAGPISSFVNIRHNLNLNEPQLFHCDIYKDNSNNNNNNIYFNQSANEITKAYKAPKKVKILNKQIPHV